MNIDQIKADLIRDERMVLHAYEDSRGYLTIGCGRLIDKRLGGGITEPEAHFLLENDIVRCMAELDGLWPWWRQMSDGRQRALCNMIFNMGAPRLVGFRNMIAALRDGEYEKAAHEAFQSNWSGQVGQRANRICKLISEG